MATGAYREGGEKKQKEREKVAESHKVGDLLETHKRVVRLVFFYDVHVITHVPSRGPCPWTLQPTPSPNQGRTSSLYRGAKERRLIDGQYTR